MPYCEPSAAGPAYAAGGGGGGEVLGVQVALADVLAQLLLRLELSLAEEAAPRLVAEGEHRRVVHERLPRHLEGPGAVGHLAMRWRCPSLSSSPSPCTLRPPLVSLL
mmetsp:Transcript_48912/g.121369  ORF Transcript_48912/g.121369 Transcript_48912/m.121369 type:complete len:107 (+) Transcript_48912:310-630(+)